MKQVSWIIVASLVSITGCSEMTTRQEQAAGSAGTFLEDRAFLEEHTDVVVLGNDPDGPQVIVAPAWQGRVMTSTADAATGMGYGWLNKSLIASGEHQPHINALGGEDRFWLGPEGGQFSIFFAPGDPFDLDYWQTPPLIDTDAYAILSRDAQHVTFRHDSQVTNYTGTVFDLRIDRVIRLLDQAELQQTLGVELGSSVQMVAYKSNNTITNTGTTAWNKDTGLLSIWILGMFQHSPVTTVVIPYRNGSVEDLGPIVNDAYFGAVPDDRLLTQDNTLFFKGDGQYRSKIGLTPKRATPVIGSYDPSRSLLTVVHYTLPDGITDYVNSMWELQDAPYAGDVLNSYNDGPPDATTPPLGPFYELETSSPAAALSPNASITHVHRTFHFEGSSNDLNAIAQTVLGVDLPTIQSVFNTSALGSESE